MTRFGSLFGLASLLFAATAAANAADTAAQAKIDEAINVHYLDTNFAKAEKTLKAAIGSCASKCTPAVVGRAWMYVGIIRAVGNQDMGGASEAFASAVEADPDVKLDADLATPEVKKLFEAAKAGGGGGATEPTEEEAPAAAPASSSGNMQCSPEVSEVETRRPIPVACTADESVKRAILHYQAPGSSTWAQLNLGQSEGYWMGQIACSNTGSSGPLRFYVTATGTAGESVDSFGSKDAPMEITLVESSAEAPPSYPGKEAPNRCMDQADCPEEMRGTPACPGTTRSGAAGGAGGGWGAACKVQADCGGGMACMGGTCETPPACETDAECNGGVCQNAVCAYSDDEGGGSADAPRNFIGVHFGMDFAQVSGAGICDPATNTEFACYLNDGGTLRPYTMGNLGDQGRAATLGSALAPATLRVMASYERLFTESIGAEIRAGLAFGGAPTSSIAQLLHLEIRGKYWFTGTGKGLRPYIAIGGGLGQTDVGVQVKVIEDADGGGYGYSPPDAATAGAYCDKNNPATALSCEMSLVAYRKFGSNFVGGGAGALLNLGPIGINLDVAARVTLPAVTLVLTPTIGAAIGF